MSNTSYSFKENSHMKDIQGGEKKVMKKILSVALSTAMAFSMFASVAFGADAKLTPQQQFDALKAAGIVTGYPDGTAGLDKTITRAELATIIVKAIDLEPVPGVATYKDQNYSVNHWAAKYIEAATEAGILTGKDAVKQLFGPNDNLTVQELAVVLVKALKLEVPAETNNTATEWAKGYVQAALDKGLIESGINYQANATRAQVVVAAHAIYEANQVPTVASYEVSEAGKVVEFKLSNDEVVKVTLDEALAPNKETEVKFSHNGHDYTHKVTYVTTVAQKVQTVSAENLKEVVVVFDGTVDKKSAENKLNYEVKDKKVDSVKLSDDKTTVTILLADESDSVLANQKETELKVKNVKNEDGTKTFEETVKFTPVDVKIPEIKEVVGLGTSAFKVVFSEPVQKSDVYASSNYKVNGVSVSGNVEYSYPNVAIINASLPTGDHKLTVSNIRDFSGLRIAPIEQSFTIAEDTAAPEIVSIKSNDLTEIEIEFNETVKTWGKVYHGVSGNTAEKVEKRDNKLIVTFPRSKPLAVTENTIYVEAVTDYSGNKANREGKVNPTLDTERPTVNKVEVKQDDATGYHELEVHFSKKVTKESAEKRTNYTIKDKDGKAVSGTGLDNDGHPYSAPVYDAETNKVTVKLGTKLDTKDYVLEVANVVDTAYVANTMLPYSVTFSAKQTVGDAITRVWTIKEGNERILYVQFKSNVKTSGEGRADLAEKYQVNGKLLKDVDVDIVSGDTVRIKSTKNDLNLVFANDGTLGTNTLTASLIQDSDGNYFKQNYNGVSSHTLTKDVSPNNKIQLSEAKATSRTELKVKFDGKVNSFRADDFRVHVRGDYAATTAAQVIIPDSAELSTDGVTLTLKFNDNNKLPAYIGTDAKVKVVASPSTSDAQGIAIVGGFEIGLIDEIRPEINDGLTVKKAVGGTATAATYELILTANDLVQLGSLSDIQKVVEVKYNDDKLTITDAQPLGRNQFVLTVDLNPIDDTRYFQVKINGEANKVLKAITDEQGNAFAEKAAGGHFKSSYTN
ncbi:S-layer homology domain-containing protein [Paenibacillus humicus]|uniref:S-layer homology domain-containing protein n=1 Tax=Paenibacillus humicus TaxID=412861 RepID=UPI003D267D36